FYQLKEHAGEVRRIGRTRALIVHHPNRPLFARQPDHRLDKVSALAAGARDAVKAGGAYEDMVIRDRVAEKVLPRLFRDPVSAYRRRRVLLPVRLFRIAVENVIGAEVHQRRAQFTADLCHVFHTQRVNLERRRRLLLTVVDAVESGRVYYQRWSHARQDRTYLVEIGD